MSNIFYSNVDKNLIKELDARGQAGKSDRSNTALDFMLTKIANVRLTAYTGNSSATDVQERFGVLGGETVREGRYIPNGLNGYLTNTSYTTSSIVFDANGKAVDNTSKPITDTSYRTGPFISDVTVNIGDHSMGLLNKATVHISIPNPMRDLEDVEDTWFRPGRFVKIEIHHPESAVITAHDSGSRGNYTGGLLDKISLPPDLDKRGEKDEWVQRLKTDLRFMNRFQFEGLITSFEFSYTETGQVDAILSLTGTSNVFTDVSMFISDTDKNKDTKKPAVDYTFQSKPPVPNSTTPAKSEFFDILDSALNTIISKTDPEKKNTGISKFEKIDINNATATDQFVLYGQPYNPEINDSDITNFLDEEASRRSSLTGSAATASLNLATRISASNDAEAAVSVYHRYITLGTLVELTNVYVTSKLDGSVDFAKIICDDATAFSNFLTNLTSCIPHDILLLPANTDSAGDMNWYGNLAFYRGVKSNNTSWPGVYENTVTTQRIFTSRIFINVEFIQSLLNSLSATNTRNYTLRNFFAGISQRISYATGGLIDLKMMSYPEDPTKMFFVDSKYLKTSTTKQPEPVFPYSVPMMANHPNGTIVRNFQFKASLPENAKNMSYILNSGDEVTEEQIAPYVNFMYNSKNAEAINAAILKYKQKHASVLKTLDETKQRLSLSVKEPEFVSALHRALANYLKFPTDDIRKSQQITAPLFPFTVDFTMDGINGLKYGDVLTFDALPMRYRVHTVFSVIGVVHNVKSNGEWTTDVKCIMRPSIE